MGLLGGFSSSDLYGPGASIGGNLSKSSGGGGGMFDPLSAGILAGGSLLSNVFSGVMGGQQANRQIEADFAIQGMKNAAAERAAFQNLLAGQYNSTFAPMVDFQRQKLATNIQQDIFDPKKMSLASEQFGRGVADQLAPDALKLAQTKNLFDINKSLAEKRAVTDAMFGPVRTTPFNYDYPSYTMGR
jgi:hypothetical protein